MPNFVSKEIPMLRIIRNKPRYYPGGPTGSIQDVNDEVIPNSLQPMSIQQLFGLASDEKNPFLENTSQQTGQNTSGGAGQTTTQPLTTFNQVYTQYTPKVDEEEEEPTLNVIQRSQDGNVFDPMSMPYFAPDLTSRAQMMGRAIGNIKVGKDNDNKGLQTLGWIGTAASGLSLGMGLAREIAGAASEQYAANRDYKSAQQRLAQERRNAMITYQQEGGGINVDGKRVDTSSMTGEYIYPLPKSMEDTANVEIEKGEYALVPDVVGPMEAKGNKHSKGGTPVNLPEAYIISDYRKIPEAFASEVRSVYGIKATPKDTYASLVDKYKKKIGLKEAYDDQEKVIARLEKTERIKDQNTSELNKSILSKYINENQKKIDDLEAELRDFADVVYKRQEDDKLEEDRKFFFREGGPVDKKTVKETAKKLGVDEEEARNMLFDAYREKVRMDEGGDAEQRRRAAQLIRDTYNRQLNFGQVDVADLESLLNEGTDAAQNQGYQAGRYYYGRGNAERVQNLLDVNRWATGLNANGNFVDNTRNFQVGYNNQMRYLQDLVDTGVISNSDAANQFVLNYMFRGQDADSLAKSNPDGNTNAYTNPEDQAYYSNSIDGKPGQTTLSKPMYSLDVVTPEELKKLNDAGIRNYFDVRNNADQVREILGADSASWKNFEKLNGSDDMSAMDFVLGSYNPTTPVQSPSEVEMPEYDTSVGDEVQLPGPVETRGVGNSDGNMTIYAGENNNQRRTGSSGLIFPEILRDRQSGIVTEGLERHYVPRVDPVLRSADQYINEMNRATQSQLDAMGDVPDSQRAAIMANMNAIAGSNIARYINEVELYNTQQRNEADRFNQTSYARMVDQNIAERQRYEESTLRAMAINDENRARYLDNLNQEAMQKFNTETSINTLRSLAPNMRVLPNGQIVYTNNGEKVMTYGDFSTPYLYSMAQQYQYNPRALQQRNTTNSTTTTTTTTRRKLGGRI